MGPSLRSGSRLISSKSHLSRLTEFTNGRDRIGKPVALKVLAARESPATAELSILEHLARVAPTHAGSKHVITFLDSFRHTGPNGTHLCLVFEVLGATTASMVLELPSNKPLRRGHRPRYAMWMAKRILRHTLLGLSFLHQNNIVHGDVQPGNLLFVPNLASVEVDKLQQDPSQNGVSTPVKRLDGKLDKWAPRYLLADAPLTEFVDLGPGLTVKLSDMGAGKFRRYFSCHSPNVKLNVVPQLSGLPSHQRNL
jgi:serine/threonine protein kinase